MTKRLFGADYFRWQPKDWAYANFFETRYEVPPIAISVDVRDGLVFTLSAITPGNEGTFDGIGLGARVGGLLERPGARWDGADGCVYLESAPGIAFLQPESSASSSEWPRKR